ncbi:MAG: lactate utilization protein C [Streptosporangiales bacterium]|nr:lactate utilization protein C [Streptosporangiales bacterium]
MSRARDEILARVRGALRDVPRSETATEPSIPRAYGRGADPDTDVAALFTDRVEHYRATVRRIAAAELATAVADRLAERTVGRLVVPADLPAEWLDATSAEVVRDDGDHTADDLDRIDAVLTGCVVAVAETGTIVLDAGRHQGRRAISLVPDYHLCVVHADQVVGTVPEAIGRLDPGRPLTWISGPSATSDIELDRVEGVHGPRTLDVLLVG